MQQRIRAAAGNIFGAEHMTDIHTTEEGTDIIISRIIEDLIRGADLHHHAALHNGDTVADTHGLVEVMGNKHDGALFVALEAQQLILHLGADQRVKGGERLIHQQDIRVISQRTGKPDPLTHPAGQLIRIRICPLLQVDLFQRIQCTVVAFRFAHPGQFQAECGIIDHRHMRHQSKGLKHHADFFTPYLTQCLIGNHSDIFAVNQHLAAGRFYQAIEKTN